MTDSPLDTSSLTRRSATNRLLVHLRANVAPHNMTWPLAGFCFMTGFVDATTFTTCFVWCAFQTGNTIQLSLALARLASPGPGITNTSLQTADRQALCSLLAFLFGAMLGQVANLDPATSVKDQQQATPTWRTFFGPKRRAWLALGSLLVALLTMAASLCAWRSGRGTDHPPLPLSRDHPLWTDSAGYAALACLSASMGLQAVLSTGLGSAFATSVVLTSIWVQLVSDRKILAPTLPLLRRQASAPSHSSDKALASTPPSSRPPLSPLPTRALAILALFIGGFTGRALMGTQLGIAGTLGVGAGLRMVLCLAWLV